jgi:hypothetical protein
VGRILTMPSKKEEIVLIAKSLLKQQIGIVEASRILIRLRYEAQLEDEENLNIFRAIDSETDHLPIGLLRENYSSTKLVEVDEEIKKCDEFYEKLVENACKNLIAKYDKYYL